MNFVTPKLAKPTIYFSNGWWRVSHMPKPWSPHDQPRWNAAHQYALRVNNLNRNHRDASRCRCCGAH